MAGLPPSLPFYNWQPKDEQVHQKPHHEPHHEPVKIRHHRRELPWQQYKLPQGAPEQHQLHPFLPRLDPAPPPPQT